MEKSRLFTDNSEAEIKIQKSLINAFNEKGWEKAKAIIQDSIKNNLISTIDIQAYITEGSTPLLKAVYKNDLPFIEYLLKNGANPNFVLKNTFVSYPIFASQSLETTMLLVNYGANLAVINEGYNIYTKMNLLHSAINSNTEDNRLFPYYRLKCSLDPQKCIAGGNTLWHSLIKGLVPHCPEERFIYRAKELHEIGISVYQKNKKGMSPLDEINETIINEKKLLQKIDSNQTEGSTVNGMPYQTIKKRYAKFKKFRSIMKNP